MDELCKWYWNRNNIWKWRYDGVVINYFEDKYECINSCLIWLWENKNGKAEACFASNCTLN
jgi:hypothetical protein